MPMIFQEETLRSVSLPEAAELIASNLAGSRLWLVRGMVAICHHELLRPEDSKLRDCVDYLLLHNTLSPLDWTTCGKIVQKYCWALAILAQNVDKRRVTVEEALRGTTHLHDGRFDVDGWGNWCLPPRDIITVG